MDKKLMDINKFTFQKLGELLFETVPQYQDYCSHDLDECFGNYTFMNEFSKALSKEIEKNNSSEFVINSFKFINQIADSDNLEVLNILKVGILEILYTNGIAIRNYTFEQLESKNKRIFSDFSNFYV
jgi:hypothetical protein